MNLVRFDTFQEIERMRRELGRLFEGIASSEGEQCGAAETWSPSVDISETKNAFRLRVDIPGVQKDQIEVRVDGNILTLKGEKKLETTQEDEKFFRRERSNGAFLREIALPQNVDEDKIRASNRDGVLIVEIPKSEKAKEKQIKID